MHSGVLGHLDVFTNDQLYTIDMQFNTNLPEFSCANKWSNVTDNEITVFFALKLLTGVVQKLVLSQYWRSTNPHLKVSITQCPGIASKLVFDSFISTITLSLNLMTVIIIQSATPNRVPGQLISNCNPEINGSVDVEILLWKGQLGFKLCIPKKLNTCYLWNSYIYLGKSY